MNLLRFGRHEILLKEKVFMKYKLTKISISNSANKSIEKMLETLNKHSLSKIKKQDFCSWIIINYENKYFSKEIPKILKGTQNPIAYAKSLIKKLESSKEELNFSELNKIFSKLKSS